MGTMAQLKKKNHHVITGTDETYHFLKLNCVIKAHHRAIPSSNTSQFLKHSFFLKKLKYTLNMILYICDTFSMI